MRGDVHGVGLRGDTIRRLLIDEFRFLTFRWAGVFESHRFDSLLLLGLFFTWLAGVGRYWDNPRAHLWQHLGLGSVLYVFVLALILWILIAPLRPGNWSYRNVLLFVMLTAPPALIYAIPVEMFLPADVARATNVGFLAVVAAWRVGLYAKFLRSSAGLSPGSVVVATLLPIAIIIVALSVLNLEHVAFSIMGGISPALSTGNDWVYETVFVLSILCFYASPVIILLYVFGIVAAARNSRAAQSVPERAREAPSVPVAKDDL